MSTQTLARPSRAFPGLAREIGRIFAAMRAGVQAAREYEHYSNRTDAALAREGIERHEIPRIVFERNFRHI